MNLQQIVKRFTFATKQAVGAAQNKAYDLHVSSITSEVVLLGLMDDAENQVSLILDKLGVDRFELNRQLVFAVAQPTRTYDHVLSFSGEIGYIWQNALAEAEALGRSQIGTEHILLGMLARPESPATVILNEHNVTPKRVYDAIRQLSATDRQGE